MLLPHSLLCPASRCHLWSCPSPWGARPGLPPACCLLAHHTLLLPAPVAAPWGERWDAYRSWCSGHSVEGEWPPPGAVLPLVSGKTNVTSSPSQHSYVSHTWEGGLIESQPFTCDFFFSLTHEAFDLLSGTESGTDLCEPQGAEEDRRPTGTMQV